MARKGYILTRNDETDKTTDNVAADQISVKDLSDPMGPTVGVVPLNPVNGNLIGGNGIHTQSLCLSPDGFLFARYCSRVFRISPVTGELIAYSSVGFPSRYYTGIYADNDFVYLSRNDTTNKRYSIHKVDRATWTLVSTITITVPYVWYSNLWYCGFGWDGANHWCSYLGSPKVIQRRNATTLFLEAEYPYPTGYEDAYFYSCQIDPLNPTHLWLQGEMGTNGVIVVWDTSTQTIVSEWSSPDRFRWMDQQFAIGGADISTPGTIQFLSAGPWVKGNVIFDYLLKDAESNIHNVVSAQYSIDGKPPDDPTKVWIDATIGTGGSGNINLPSSLTGEYLKKAWDTITDTGPGDTLGVYYRLILEES